MIRTKSAIASGGYVVGVSDGAVGVQPMILIIRDIANTTTMSTLFTIDMKIKQLGFPILSTVPIFIVVILMTRV